MQAVLALTSLLVYIFDSTMRCNTVIDMLASGIHIPLRELANVL